MEVLLFIIGIMVFLYHVGGEENENRQQPNWLPKSPTGLYDQNNNPVPEFSSSTKFENMTLDNGNKVDVINFNIKGFVGNPQNRAVKLVSCGLVDITDSNNPSYVISLDQQSSLQGLFCTYQTIESTDTTFFPEFLCLYVMPIDLLKFPYKGKNRKIECSYFVVDDSFDFTSYSTLASNPLHFSSPQFYIDVDDLGWKEKIQNADKIAELSIDLCISMAASDGSLDQSELDIIKKWTKDSFAHLEQDENQKNNKNLQYYSNYIKESYLKTKSNANTYTLDLNQFLKLSDNADRVSLIELLLKVIGADGVFSKEEDSMLNEIVKKLDVNQDTFMELKNRALLSIDKLETSESSNEQLFGITEMMSNEEKCRTLREQYTKWNAQASSADINKREKAVKMISLIVDLRVKYKCQ